jgi:uncharacterized protein YndB with AHSA1/START domain
VAETPGTTERIEHEVRVDAPPEVVFEYFTDPSKLVRWMGNEATLDPRPGGVCRFDINGSRMIGEYVQVDFPWRIVFTWGWQTRLFEVGEQSTAVEVALTADGDATIVRLTHSRLPEGAVAFHRAGWGHYLERLSAAAGGNDPGPDPWRDPMLVLRAMQAEDGQ